MKPKWFNLTAGQQEELAAIVPSSRWRIIPQSELPSVFPEPFRARLDSAVVVSTPTSTGGMYVAYSANRVDFKAQQIDIEPFGLIVHSTGPDPSGLFLHHGNWTGRTEPPPGGFWEAVNESGVGNYFYSNPPEGKQEGSIHELSRGHRGAFEALIREIRARIDRGAK